MNYRGLAYQSTADDPIEFPEALPAGIGKDSKDYIDSAFSKMLVEAKKNGLTKEGLPRLAEMLEEYRDVFESNEVPILRLKSNHFGSPMSKTLTHITALNFDMPLKQREIIVRTIEELEAVEAIYQNPKARWASPALAVKKSGYSRLRFTADRRGPNARTVPITSAMPHLESHLQDIEGSTCFANQDFSHGYWQVPLSNESQEMMTIQTPIGVYSSKRLLQGRTDSGNHFQAVLQEKFHGRVNNMLQWSDDILFYAKDEQALRDNMEEFFRV